MDSKDDKLGEDVVHSFSFQSIRKILIEYLLRASKWGSFYMKLSNGSTLSTLWDAPSPLK